MDERSGLDRLIFRLKCNLAVSYCAKFVIDKFHEATKSFLVAITP
jgi:hypothetical protein